MCCRSLLHAPKFIMVFFFAQFLGKFLTSYLGSSVGIALCYPIFGFIISFSSSWETVFYASGVLGTLWYAAWLYFVYDSPAEHPRIDRTERLYIEECLRETVHAGKVFIKAKNGLETNS